jgi:hypothetical protein
VTENPIVKERDARERAVRSFLWGLLIDASCTAGVALLAVINSLEWTATYWQGLGLLLAKSFVQAGVAYIGRKVIEPYIKSRG